MKTAKLVAAGVLVFAAAYGCRQSGGDDTGNTEDRLVGFRGSVDHAAIVEGSTIHLTTANVPIAVLDPTLDDYNQEDPFHITSPAFHDAFARNLIKFDAIDGKTDWTPDTTAKWLARMASNYLVIDTERPCDFADPHTYLEIERALLTGKEHATCGGRMPNEDSLDVTMNFLARGPAAQVAGDDAISDGVDQATQKSSDTFPYLAELND